MKSKKEKIEENEPGNIPVITSQMMEKTAIEIAKRKAGKDESPVIRCERCQMSFMQNSFDGLLK